MSESSRGGSVWTVIGTVLITLTLTGGCGLLCLVGGVGTAVGWTGYRWNRATSQANQQQQAKAQQSAPLPSGSTPGARPASTSPGAPGLDGIADLEPDRWHVISEGPPMPLNRFDPVQGTAWATEVARAWRPDAQLHLAFLSHVQPNGFHDLLADDDADADYRFFSPELTRLAVKAETVTDETVWSGFRVWIHDGEVNVMITDSTFTKPSMKDGDIDPDWSPFPGFGDGCTAAAAIRTVRADASVPKRPAYDLALRWWGRGGWKLGSDPGNRDLDPSTCAVKR